MGDQKLHTAINIEDEMRRSYIDYAMSVIIGRAIPDVKDGLKPVHRRILYGMYDLRNFHDQPPKKSARVVGDVIGKYHPHGDTAVYDALVRMAQDFSMRHTLVEGQGNFGSIDGDPPAAMRYTEVRMSRLAKHLLEDIEKDTVDFVPNYDETTEEPNVMPARFPNLLLNGTSGIAVGMATNIPPHNLGELIDGIIAVIKAPEITIKKLMEYIPGPDFPTRGFIYGASGIKDAYETGRGRIVIRAKAMIETQTRTGKTAIIVKEIPYGVNKAKLIERIADLVRSRKIDGVSDLRDESDREGMRIVIELRKDVVPPIVLNRLYKTTPMESSFGVIMLAIVNGRPEILNLKDAILHFIYHRRDVVLRRTRYELKRAEERAHILVGLVKALENIDEVISIIKSSKSQPEAKERLMKRFKFSDIQAQAILDMRLGRLTSLEIEKVIKEYEEVLALIKELKKILSDEKVLVSVIVGELMEIKEEFADERRTEIVEESKELTIEDLVAQEDMVVTVSHNGYIKRAPLNLYRSQKRGGKGMSGMDTSEDDFVENLFVAKTHDQILIFTDAGKAYGLRVHEIPQGGRVGKGRSVANLVQMSSEEKIASMLVISDSEDESKDAQKHHIVLATRKGMIKKTEGGEFKNAKHAGLVAMGLAEGDSLVSALLASPDKEIFVATAEGYAARFMEGEVRAMGRSAQGVKAVSLGKDDVIVGIDLVEKGTTLLAATERGFGKRSKTTEYPQQKRGGKGVITLKTTERTGKVIRVKMVSKDDGVIMISNKGKFLRLNAKDVPVQGRNTQGVKMMNLDNDERLTGMVVLAEKEEESEDQK
ncbi:MAG: DNA gyrase subunit A [Deltaproteobacteria bacterium]|uniref:DNA gyrase subunit A n=1 Tax=Candidatus Zymogenus saltonus TaxID=2844893 RepID=A0A9D8KI89_9DELT|nr:DNA gyrase subunit A [Candidatus Zymogenus saltonus]